MVSTMKKRYFQGTLLVEDYQPVAGTSARLPE
jgi:hypothetical protein